MDEEELTAGEEWAATNWNELRARREITCSYWGCIVIVIVTVAFIIFLYILGGPSAPMFIM